MKFDALTIFLNRACPRGCPQCGISKSSRKPLSIEQWKKALLHARDVFGTKFFLFLGTEPLLFKDGLVELIKFFADEGIYYAFYSTSPEPLFSQYRKKLVDAGLRNWSSGIDALPSQAMGWDWETQKKIRDSILGLQWMGEHGVQTHTQLTLHRQNLDHAIKILRWCQENIKGVQSTVNFIEWQKAPHFDFFSPAHEMQDLMWEGTEEERDKIRKVMGEIKMLSRVKGYYIQTPDAYLDEALDHYTGLNRHCRGIVGPCIDCDGTMRLCAYSTGRLRGWSIFDLDTPAKQVMFYRKWSESLSDCSGCHWIFPYMLEGDIRILNPSSGFHEDRWDSTIEQFEQKTGVQNVKQNDQRG